MCVERSISNGVPVQPQKQSAGRTLLFAVWQRLIKGGCQGNGPGRGAGADHLMVCRLSPHAGSGTELSKAGLVDGASAARSSRPQSRPVPPLSPGGRS
jgi:hypothetical protein